MNVLELKPARKTRVSIVLKDGEVIAKMIAFFGNTGTCRLSLWANGQRQDAVANGYGYNKVNACLCGMRIDGNKLDASNGLYSLPQGVYKVIDIL